DGHAGDLRAAGRTVVDRAALLDEARAVGLDQAGMSWVDARGRVRAAMPADAFGGEGFSSEIEILRGDLVDLLHRQLDQQVEWLFSDTVTALEQDEHGVDVAFRDALPRRFDFVIGADGLHSDRKSVV